MKVLVTGGAGFIGSNFIEYLLTNTDYSIVNVDALTYAGTFKDTWDRNRYTFYHQSIGLAPAIDAILYHEQPEFIVNFAAETHVDRSITHPDAFVQANLFDTYQFICAVQRYTEENPRCKFIHISTDEVYGQLGPHDPPFTETSPYLPNSPYSATKAGGDHLVRSFIHTFNLPAIITHCSNNYGPRQHPEKFIPTVIRKVYANEQIPVYGTGTNVRDWLHVQDHCNAIYRIMLDGKIGEVYNIGGNTELTNVEVVGKILHIMNKDDSLISFVEDRRGHDFRYAISTDKIARELNWTPSVSFDDGLYRTVEWYLANMEWVTSCVS